MTLLNHLFGNKSSVAKELGFDDKKRIMLWEEHLANFAKREELSKRFNLKNVDSLLADFNATSALLGQIESLISPELVHINDEERNDEEILSDIERLKSNKELEKLTGDIVHLKQKESLLLALFKELHDILKTELRLIRLIKRKPANSKELLLKLFNLIFHREARANKVFQEENYYDESKHLHANVMKIAKAILLEQEIKEELETDEERFSREMVEKMIPGGSSPEYHKLGEEIFLNLAEMAGEPFSGSEPIEGIRKMEAFMKNDEVMIPLVRRLMPGFDEVHVRGTIMAFSHAFNLHHFEALEMEFMTWWKDNTPQ